MPKIWQNMAIIDLYGDIFKFLPFKQFDRIVYNNDKRAIKFRPFYFVPRKTIFKKATD